MAPVVVQASVDGDGEGNLTVVWELVGDGAIEVALGPAPDAIDHEHPVAVVEGDRRVELHGVGPGRHYVSVAPSGGGSGVVAAERLVRLEGASNFRDLGGYRTTSGERVRWGMVFRSDALHALTVEDLAVIGRLGLRVVYDLRRDAERRRDPSVALPGDVRRELLTIGGAAGQGGEILERIRAGEIDRLDDDFLVEAYQTMAGRDAAIFGRLLTGLTDPGGLPALFHCSAGKDRTGISAALLLSLLGVDPATVLEDYGLTSRYYSDRKIEELRPSFEARGIDIERFRSLFSAPRAAMEGLLATIDERFGGVDRYLVEEAEMAPETLTELRQLLLQSA